LAPTRKSAGILEKLYDQNPQHPGVTHFLIHAYARLTAYNKAMEQLAQSYPDDYVGRLRICEQHSTYVQCRCNMPEWTMPNS
jgi:hypothetical protein